MGYKRMVKRSLDMVTNKTYRALKIEYTAGEDMMRPTFQRLQFKRQSSGIRSFQQQRFQVRTGWKRNQTVFCGRTMGVLDIGLPSLVPNDTSFLFQYNAARHFSTFQNDPYRILGVSMAATEKEIKQAFYKLAKEHHPDMSHDHSKKQADKFKQIAWAYEILSDPVKRTQYDTTGSTDNTHSSASMKEAEDLFSQVWRDLGVADYFKEVQADAGTALHAARHGDYSLLWDFVKERKVLLSGILVPVILFVRFPGMIAIVIRFAIAATIALLQSLPPQVAFNLFRRIFLR